MKRKLVKFMLSNPFATPCMNYSTERKAWPSTTLHQAANLKAHTEARITRELGMDAVDY